MESSVSCPETTPYSPPSFLNEGKMEDGGLTRTHVVSKGLESLSASSMACGKEWYWIPPEMNLFDWRGEENTKESV